MMPCVAAQEQPYVVRTLSADWLVYDRDFDGYVPYSPNQHGVVNTASFWLQSSLDSAYHLRVIGQPKLCVYFNQKLYKYFEHSDTAYIPLNTLFAETRQRRIFVTFYHPQVLQSSLSVALVNLKQMQRVSPEVKIKKKASSFQIQLRQTTQTEVYVIGILLIIALYVFVKNSSSKEFARFFDVRALIINNADEFNSSLRKTWTGFNFLIVIADSLCLSFVFFMVQNEYKNSILSFGAEGLNIPIDEWWLIRIPSYWLFALSYFVVKYILISITGYIFNLSKLSGIHYFEFLRTSTWASLIILLWAVLAYIGKIFSPEVFIGWLQLTIIVFALLRVFKMIVALNKMSGFHNLYLFSYLCATEIIPIILVSQLFSFQ
jgi:hypothetical protein